MRAVALDDQRAYIGEGNALAVLDVSDPSQPSPLGRLQLPSLVEAVAVADGLAYVAIGLGGLAVVDVREPAAPALIGSVDSPDNARAWEVVAEGQK